MRLCRFQHNQQVAVGFYEDTRVISLSAAVEAYQKATGENLMVPSSEQLIDYLPPDGSATQSASRVYDWITGLGDDLLGGLAIGLQDAQLLVPNPRPNKLFLLAGNYAAHIEEGNWRTVTASKRPSNE